MPSHVRDDSHTRAARPWRVLFVLYAIALTVGTHWPQLELHLVDLPAPDKVLHMLGFGGLAFLLWRTRWVRMQRGGWPLAIIMLAWAAIDELTQAIPILGRTFSWLDILGGWLGIMLVLVWIWATKPIGSDAAQARYRVNERIVDDLFLQPRTWAMIVVAGLLGTAILGMPMALYVRSIEPRFTLGAFASLGVPAGAFAALATLVVLVRRGQMAHGVSPLPHAAWREAIWHAAATFIGGASLLAALYMLAWHTHLHAPWAMLLLDGHDAPDIRTPMDLRLAIDLTLLGILLAASIRVARETLTRAIDQQSAPT